MIKSNLFRAAFPQSVEMCDQDTGISFLEYYAVHALQGILANPAYVSLHPHQAAKEAVDCAIALRDELAVRDEYSQSAQEAAAKIDASFKE